MVLWLFLMVVLSVYEVLDRSLFTDVAVTVFGEDDIRIGGRRIVLEDELLRVDDDPVELRNGRGSWGGVTVVTDGSKNPFRHIGNDPPSRRAPSHLTHSRLRRRGALCRGRPFFALENV